jgi:hypothetical protein
MIIMMTDWLTDWLTDTVLEPKGLPLQSTEPEPVQFS